MLKNGRKSMKPDRIFVVRHGQSMGNIDKNLYKTVPDYALQLTHLGIEQAVAVGKNLKKIIGNDSIKFYVSPLWRTRETYQGIIKNFPKFEKNSENFYEDPRLREQEWCGKLRKDGFMHEEESERDAYGHFYYRFNGGESCADVFDRISGFLDTLHREFEKKNFPQNCLIITHGMTMRIFLMRFFHLSVEEFETLKNPKNCQLITLALIKNKYKLISELERYKERRHEYQFDWSKDIS